MKTDDDLMSRIDDVLGDTRESQIDVMLDALFGGQDLIDVTWEKGGWSLPAAFGRVYDDDSDEWVFRVEEGVDPPLRRFSEVIHSDYWGVDCAVFDERDENCTTFDDPVSPVDHRGRALGAYGYGRESFYYWAGLSDGRLRERPENARCVDAFHLGRLCAERIDWQP